MKVFGIAVCLGWHCVLARKVFACKVVWIARCSEVQGVWDCKMFGIARLLGLQLVFWNARCVCKAVGFARPWEYKLVEIARCLGLQGVSDCKVFGIALRS